MGARSWACRPRVCAAMLLVLNKYSPICQSRKVVTYTVCTALPPSGVADPSSPAAAEGSRVSHAHLVWASTVFRSVCADQSFPPRRAYSNSDPATDSPNGIWGGFTCLRKKNQPTAGYLRWLWTSGEDTAPSGDSAARCGSVELDLPDPPIYNSYS